MLKQQMPEYHYEWRMNQRTLDRLAQHCQPLFPGSMSIVPQFMGLAIIIKPDMTDDRVGIVTLNSNGEQVNYEVIEAFQ
jgi:hypothetical protein